MKINIYIWARAPTYSPEKWKNTSLAFLNGTGYNRIIINHHLKQYRKNFKCTKIQLTTIIEKAKTMKPGHENNFII